MGKRSASKNSNYPKFVGDKRVTPSIASSSRIGLKKDFSNPLSIPPNSAIMQEANTNRFEDLRNKLSDKFGPRLLVEQDFVSYNPLNVTSNT
jgi:hypothetical protein